MRPFGCPVTILNTLDHLGKFDGKADEGFLVRYSVNSKAFKVFNSRTRKVEENPHGINLMVMQVYKQIFMQDKPLRRKQQFMNTFCYHLYLPIYHSLQLFRAPMLMLVTNQEMLMLVIYKVMLMRHEEMMINIIDDGSLNINTTDSNHTNMPTLEATGIFDGVFDDRDLGAEADTNNLDSSIVFSPISTTRVHKDHPKEQIIGDLNLNTQTRRMEKGIDYDEVFALVARKEAIRLFLAYASFKDFIFYQMDVKSAFLYGKIEEEVYVCQPPGFEDPDFPDKVYKVKMTLYGLHQALRAWICDAFETLMHENFQMSSMGELTFFLGLQVKQNYRLISWHCKKQTVVANFITEAEYVAALSCCGQVIKDDGWFRVHEDDLAWFKFELNLFPC
nr:putative ribonuclease H-like domain-containing protein [Tanacetum cinerariifolium]